MDRNLTLAISVLLLLGMMAIVRADVEPVRPMHYSGQLFTEAGKPIADGEHQMTFSIYDNADDGDMTWTQALSVTTVGGWFSADLTMTADDLPQSPDMAWMATNVDALEVAPRQIIGVVPYALHADIAEVAETTDEVTLSNLFCSIGQTVMWDGEEWVCADM